MLMLFAALFSFWIPLIFGRWIVSVAIVAICGLLSLLPLEGFKDKVCEYEIELLPLKCSEGKQYVYVIGKKATFAYDNSEQYGLDGIAYQEKSVKGKIIIYESNTCKQPVLKVFKTEPVRDISFAPFSTKYEYVFYIPDAKTLGESKKQNIIV